MNINFATRQLIRSSSRGYLSTQFNPKNFKKSNLKFSFPYSTFSIAAFDYDLSPILLLSDLSEHTTNIKNNSYVSIMFCEEKKMYNYFPEFKNKIKLINYEDPMSRPRVTLIGKLSITKKKIHKERFLSRHPAARLYSNFSDMNFYKLKIDSAHLVGGFAHVKWFKRNDLILTKISNFEKNEALIMDHMNNHHQKSIHLYLKKLMLINSFKNWKIVGIDPDGFDLRKKGELIRMCFEKELLSAQKLRGKFIQLHKSVK